MRLLRRPWTARRSRIGMVNDHVRFGKSSENLFLALLEGPTVTADSNTDALVLITLQSIQCMELLLVFIYRCNDTAARQNLRFNTSRFIWSAASRNQLEERFNDVGTMQMMKPHTIQILFPFSKVCASFVFLVPCGVISLPIRSGCILTPSIVEHTIQPHLLEPYLAFYSR